MIKRPLYNFVDTSELGINLVPLNSIVYINDADGNGNSKIIVLISKNTITGSSTIQDLLDNGALYQDLTASKTTKVNFTATTDQTEFVTDYNTESVIVFVGGIKLRSTEYTATNGTSIILEAQNEGTWVQVISNSDSPALTGNGIDNITRTTGDGSEGTTDTYTITYTNTEIDTFDVYQGNDGNSINSITRTTGDGSPGTTDTYTIDYNNIADTYFDVYQGADGTPTTLTAGTITDTSYGITSDGGTDDIILPQASTTEAGLLSATKWNEIVANNAKVSYPGTADATELNILDGATLSTTELNTLTGITADVGELNILDGVTADASELNYVDGVTSSIQDQFDDLSVPKIIKCISASTAQDADTAHYIFWDTPITGMNDTDYFTYNPNSQTDVTEIKVLITGIYRVYYNFGYHNTQTGRCTVEGSVRIGALNQDETIAQKYSRGAAYETLITGNNSSLLSLTANDIVSIYIYLNNADAAGAVTKTYGSCSISIEFVR